MKKNAEIIRQSLRMLGFMDQNRLFVHPAHSLADRAEAILDAGHCLCDIKRKKCPCTQALGEIKKSGHCRCKIFFSRKGMEDFYSSAKSKD